MSSGYPPAGDAEHVRGSLSIAITRTASSSLGEALTSYGYNVVYVDYNEEVRGRV